MPVLRTRRNRDHRPTEDPGRLNLVDQTEGVWLITGHAGIHENDPNVGILVEQPPRLLNGVGGQNLYATFKPMLEGDVKGLHVIHDEDFFHRPSPFQSNPIKRGLNKIVCTNSSKFIA